MLPGRRQRRREPGAPRGGAGLRRAVSDREGGGVDIDPTVLRGRGKDGVGDPTGGSASDFGDHNRLDVESVSASGVEPGPRGSERGWAERCGHFGAGVSGYGCVRRGIGSAAGLAEEVL